MTDTFAQIEAEHRRAVAAEQLAAPKRQRADIALVAAMKRHKPIELRRKAARSSSGSVTNPLSIDRPCPIRIRPAIPRDPRPMAVSREPCLRCQTRGDLGCEHQAPFVPGSENA